ncbi:FUN14 domain-containing protein [Halobaculum limi]|uniref:FUN14 domain-containing protein n=1 Tax=Halobaculum limi TaxID=3031916 RepID=UPI002406AB65|nr:FUN14 domain-containing protein [Halobaculum sp. YSMS11]
MPAFDVIAQLGIDPQKLGLELGTGAVVGGIIGFAAKKIAKLLAVIVGLELALFKFLESRGVLTVNWDKLGATFMSAGEAATANQPPTWVQSILSTLSVSAGFTGGFFIGFKRG